MRLQALLEALAVFHEHDQHTAFEVPSPVCEFWGDDSDNGAICVRVATPLPAGLEFRLKSLGWFLSDESRPFVWWSPGGR